MSRIMTLLGGIALGASLAYTLDPVSGTRRRAVMRDKGRRALRSSRRIVGRVRRDLARPVSAVADLHEGENPLTTHTRSGGLTAKQAGLRRPRRHREWRQEQRSPSLRLATAAAVGLGLLYGTKWLRRSEPSPGAAPSDAGARKERR